MDHSVYYKYLPQLFFINTYIYIYYRYKFVFVSAILFSIFGVTTKLASEPRRSQGD